MANRENYPASLFPLRGDLTAEAGATNVIVLSASSPLGFQLGPLKDAGFSNIGPASIALGNGTAGDFTGSLKLTGVLIGAASSRSAPLHIGNSTTNNSVDSQVLVSRTVDDSVSGNGHAFSDSSTITRSGVIGYNSYDCRVLFSGSQNFDHYAGIQLAPTYNSTGIVANLYGTISAPTVSNGTVTNLYHHYAANAVKNAPGNIGTQFGFYVDSLTTGGQNYAFYSIGTTPSQLGGMLTVGSNLAGVGQALNYGNGGILYANSDHQIGLGHFFYWNTGSGLDCAVDGNIRIANNAENGFGRLQFGGTTSSFPSIKRSSAGLIIRLADDSADTTIEASVFQVNGTDAGISRLGAASLAIGNGTAGDVTGSLKLKSVVVVDTAANTDVTIQNSSLALADGTAQNSPLTTMLGAHFTFGASATAGWTVQQLVGTTASATITNISESAGNVVTLTINTAAFTANNGAGNGFILTLSGLSVATWLNGQNITLTSGQNTTTLTFTDPTGHGALGSQAETGTITQVNPINRIQFVPVGIVSGTSVDAANSATVPQPQICFGTPGGSVPVTIRIAGTGTTDAILFMTNTLNIVGGSAMTFTINGTNQFFNFFGANVGGSTAVTICPDLGQFSMRGNVILSSVAPVGAGTDADYGILRIGGSTLSLDTGQISAGSVALNQLATPNVPTLAVGGTPGASTWGYKLVGLDVNGQPTAATTEVTIGTGAATLDGTHTIIITAPATRAPGVVTFAVYRTTVATSPATTGLIGTITQWGVGQSSRTLTDNGLAASPSGVAASAFNNTGGVVAPGGVISQVSVNAGMVVGGLRGTSFATNALYPAVAGWTSASIFNLVPSGSASINSGVSLRFWSALGVITPVISWSAAVDTNDGMAIQAEKNVTGQFLVLAGASGTSATTPCVVLGGNGGNNGKNFSATAGTQIAVSVGGGAGGGGDVVFNPASGSAAFVGFQVKPTINQTGSASGSYTALKVNVVETALLGTSNLLLDLQAGTTGGTSRFSVDNSGQTVEKTANAATWAHGQTSELITLSTIGATTDSAANLLPANSIIEAVVARVTTTITTATDWKLGDGTTADRFTAADATMTSGETQVGLRHQQGSISTDATGPVQTTAAKLRITTTGTPGAGVIRVTVFYRQFVAPTS